MLGEIATEFDQIERKRVPCLTWSSDSEWPIASLTQSASFLPITCHWQTLLYITNYWVQQRSGQI